MVFTLPMTDYHTFVSNCFRVFQISAVPRVWPTALKLGCVTNFDMLFLVLGFISLVDEIQFMLISSRHIRIRSIALYFQLYKIGLLNIIGQTRKLELKSPRGNCYLCMDRNCRICCDDRKNKQSLCDKAQPKVFSLYFRNEPSHFHSLRLQYVPQSDIDTDFQYLHI